MSTVSREPSSDYFPERKNSEGIMIRSIRKRESHEQQVESPFIHYSKAVAALLLLYGFYVCFGLLWISALNGIGESLLWGFFGVFMIAFAGMAGGVWVSMRAQRIGWWMPATEAERKQQRDTRGQCCGWQLY